MYMEYLQYDLRRRSGYKTIHHSFTPASTTFAAADASLNYRCNRCQQYTFASVDDSRVLRLSRE